MSTEKNIRLRQRIDTYANWYSKNGTLLQNEIGIDSTNRIVRRGTADNQSFKNASILYHPGDEYIVWGGKDIHNDSYGTTDAMLIKELGANNNQWAFFPADYITIEYSIDGGETWQDKGCSSATKTKLVSNPTASGSEVKITIGDMVSGSSTRYSTVNDLLRITLDCDGRSYFQLQKLALKITECPKKYAWAKVEGALKDADFQVLKDKTTIAGWPGWNILNNWSNVMVGGYTSQNSQFKQIRITIGLNEDTNANNISSGYYGALGLLQLAAYGTYQIIAPSSLSKTGHLYSYDYLQNAYFPNKVTATNGFIGNADTASGLQYQTRFHLEGDSYKGYHQICQIKLTKSNAYGAIMFSVSSMQTEAWYNNIYEINVSGNTSAIAVKSAKQITGVKLEKPLLWYTDGNIVYIHAWKGKYSQIHTTNITCNQTGCEVTWVNSDSYSTVDAILNEDYHEFTYIYAQPSDIDTSAIVGNTLLTGDSSISLSGSDKLYARADHTHLLPKIVEGVDTIFNTDILTLQASELQLLGYAHYNGSEIAIKEDIIYPKVIITTEQNNDIQLSGNDFIIQGTLYTLDLMNNPQYKNYNFCKIEIEGYYPIYFNKLNTLTNWSIVEKPIKSYTDDNDISFGELNLSYVQIDNDIKQYAISYKIIGNSMTQEIYYKNPFNVEKQVIITFMKVEEE